MQKVDDILVENDVIEHHIDDDDDDYDEVDINEYCLFGTHQIVDIDYLDDVSLNVIDIVYIALHLMTL